MDNINHFPTNFCNGHHSTNQTSNNNGNPDEISVSVSPCCFNLAEDGETESTLEVSNNNSFPIYFKLVTTNAVAMFFKPSSGKIEPNGKVLIKGYHAKSATPIGLQQTIGVMAARIPLEDWPNEDYCQPLNYRETLEVQLKDWRESSNDSVSLTNDEEFDYKKYRQLSYRSPDQHHSSSPRKDIHREEIYKKTSRAEMEDTNVLNGFRKDDRIKSSFYEFRPSSNATKYSGKPMINKKISECMCRLCDGVDYEIDDHPKAYQKTCETRNDVREEHGQFQHNREHEQKQNSNNYNTNETRNLYPNSCRKRNTATKRNQDIEDNIHQNFNTKHNQEFARHDHDEEQSRFSRNQQQQQTVKETKNFPNLSKTETNSPTGNDEMNNLPKESDLCSKKANKCAREKKKVERNFQSKCFCEHCIESNHSEVGSTSSSEITKDISESSDINSFSENNNEEHAVHRSLFIKCNKMFSKCNTVLKRVDSKINFLLLCMLLIIVLIFITVFFFSSECRQLTRNNKSHFEGKCIWDLFTTS